MRLKFCFIAAPFWVLVFVPHAWGALPLENPLNANIPKTSWSVELQDVVTIPNSSGSTKPRLEFLTAGGTTGLAYVIDQRGKIYSFDPAASSPSPSLFLDISVAVANFNNQPQTGVRGLAFHPDFNNSGTDGFGKFYTAHSRNGFAPLVGNPVIFPSPPNLNHDSVVGEWQLNPNGTVNTNSYRELLRIGQPFDDHNIGQIGFNPNASVNDADYGKLYVALGDGGNQQPANPIDPHDHGQDISKPWGSILRIDPLASGGDPFTVPSDNPFRVSNNPGTSQNLIWAYGLRNPHRFTFDTAGDHKMLISDIGQANIEEINLGTAGANFGWDLREGTFQTISPFSGGLNPVDNLPANHAADAFTYPVAQYDHRNNLVNGSGAVVGGAVYRGTAVPQLKGLYIFGEFATNSGPLFAVEVDDLVQRDDFSNLSSLNNGHLAPFEEIRLTHNGVEKSLRQIIDDALPGSVSRTDLRFGVGPDGEIYVLNKHDGIIRKLVSVSGIIEGDADRDGDVDGADFLSWQRGIGKSDGNWSDGNFNGDNTIDILDLAIWQQNYGSALPWTASQSVPEPTSLLLVLGILTPTFFRRRK